MEINQQRIEDGIIREVADKIFSDGDIQDSVNRDIDARVDRLFASRVNDQITAAIDAAVKAGFDREYSKRDSFGRQIGEPTTISKELDRMISGYWTQRVDQNGKPSEAVYSATMTRAEWLMGKMVAADFEKEMKQHVVNVGGALKDHFRSVLHQHVNGMLSEVFRVKSVDDAAMHHTKQGMASISIPASPIGS